MEKLLTAIGEFLSTEIDEVDHIEYVDREMGEMFYICMKDGKKILLSLIDSNL